MGTLKEIGKAGMGIATGAANTAVGQIMGMLFGKAQDKRQLEQQKKLNQLGLDMNKEALEQQRQKEMQMWNDTNIGAQKREMEKEGLNPALLYGMGGSTGTNVGGSSGANAASAANAARIS